ncbi:MAG: peptidoglycan-binding protein LysM [Parvularculaceae bacterium]|nr:peptidoglycan-binding protein LysM [Parvularculaceae bacterium]
MNIFEFARDAGESLRGSIGDLAGGIKDRIAGNKTQVDDLKVEHDGDKVILTGNAKSRAEAEKAIIAAGNTPGVSKVESRIDVSDTAEPAVFYTVKSGDTLSKIAKAHYGDAMKYPAIFEANKPMLKDPDKIYPGQVLRIPPATAA